MLHIALRRWDDTGFVMVSKHGDVSFASDLSGERGISTWKQRFMFGAIHLIEGIACDTTTNNELWNGCLVNRTRQQDAASGPNFKNHLTNSQDIGKYNTNGSP